MRVLGSRVLRAPLSRRLTNAAALLLAGTIPTPLHAQESALDRYVRVGLERSFTVREQHLAAQQAEARWVEARRQYLPTVQLDARYSRATGGRSFEIPTGDLMNPVYGALNDILQRQGRPAQFPTIDNQLVEFVRGREQDTRIRVSQVLWNPAIRGDIRSAGYRSAASEAGLEATRRQLVRDVKVAYYGYAQAVRGVAILDAAVAMVAENERSATALWQASLTTRDQVHRVRAERLEIEQQRDQAEVDRALASSYLNYLLDHPSDEPIELDPADLALPADLERSWVSAASSGSGAVDAELVDALVRVAMRDRSELRQLESAALAADAGASAIRGSTLPSLAFAIDAGIQGEDYGFSSEDRFVMASLVLSWNVTSGGAERARVRGARLEADRLRTQRQDFARRVRLEVERAARNALVALNGLSSARERVLEAEGAFRLVDRRQDEGLATGLEFLDARASLTRAQLGLSITETEALIRLAELDYAAGSTAQPVLAARTLEDER